MSKDIIELGAILRKRQTADAMKRIAPQIAEIKADFERRMAEKDMQIATLASEIERLRNENENLSSIVSSYEEASRAAAEKAKAAEAEKPAAQEKISARRNRRK